MDYDYINHSKTLLVYHIVLVTKYRHKILDQIQILDIIKLTESISDFEILEQEFEPDHLHLLVKLKPNTSPSSIIRRIKMISTSIAWKNHKNLLQKYFWKKKVLWSSGFFICTIGNASMSTIRIYIQNQG